MASASAAMLLAPMACTNRGDGDSGDGGDGGGGTSSTGGAGGEKNDGGTGGQSVQAPGACGPVAPAPLRRLSRLEYAGSIRALFPKTFPPDADGVWRLDNHAMNFQRAGQASARRVNLFQEPAEDVLSHGFANRAKNMNPTSLHIDRFNDVAALVAEHVWRTRKQGAGDAFLPCDTQDLACGTRFVEQFGERAFRRPLTAEEKTDFVGLFEQELKANTFDVAVVLTLEAFLQAPQFLYRAEIGDSGTLDKGAVKLTAFELASRLSYLLWSSSPDEELMAAAKSGDLLDTKTLETQARRMLSDKRFVFMAVEFFRQWGDFDRIFSETYRRRPGFPSLAAGHSVPSAYRTAARDEMQWFVEWLMTDGDASIETLLTSRKSRGNGYLATLYGPGVPLDEKLDAALDKTVKDIALDAQQRSGYLTRALFNWTYSRFDTPSPPLRGAFVIEKLLCSTFPPPPADALSVAPPPPAGPTNRELFEANVKARSDCPVCHKSLDGIGFGFENYNEVGGYRTLDKGRPVNANGELFDTDVDGKFNGAVELSAKLASSETVRHCMMKHLYEYATGRDAEGTVEDEGIDSCRLKALDQLLLEKKGDLREALVGFVTSPDFVWRPAP
ncbi:MAG: DUF1592 domain-containing protein [Deltaproteobacteria bacterium]|nr:DUF1592 domain-containing protein [Deltaproteobacteria bacterium]